MNVNYLKKNLKSKLNKKFIIMATIFIVFFIFIKIALSPNNIKSADIGKIIKISETYGKDKTDEDYTNQILKIKISNGEFKGKIISVENKFYSSLAFNTSYDEGDEVFLTIKTSENGDFENAVIKYYKRDNYIFYVLYLFIIILTIIAGFKGLRALLVLIVNISIFLITVKLLLIGFNPLLLSIIICILFVVLSVPIVSGINKKTVSAITSTFCSIGLTMGIILIVFHFTGTTEISYQEMDYFTNLPPEANFTIIDIFYIEVLIGTLGGVIDNAVSIASAMTEIYENNKEIKTWDLIKSGMEVGRDMLGTMTTTVLMAYISGSIPLILILLLNRISILGILSIEIYLEITRAIPGGIGIVVSVPTTIAVLTFFIKKKDIIRGARV
jgi:uncharacterized membrane protein